MGKTDTITKDYMRNPAVFADAFNKFLYHGRQAIDPESLTELDSTQIAVPYGEGSAAVPEQKYRDVLKLAKTDGNVAYCILSIENQSSTHYAMPVRNMVYDALQLAHQVSEAAQSHKRKDKSNDDGDAKYEPSSEEYLSGFYKSDKLLPVVTLVIYWGPDRWDGPLSLREMYATTDDAIMQYVPDYKVNLIAPGQMAEEEIREFQTSLKEVMLYIKYSKDKTKLMEVTQTEPGFKELDRQAAEVINVTTNSKLRYPEGKETIDMCVAIEEMRIDSEIKGAVETYKKVGFSLQETIERITNKYNFSLEEVKKIVTECWKE